MMMMLLHDTETWTLKADMINRLETFEMWLYRRMLSIPWTAMQINEAVLHRANVVHTAYILEVRDIIVSPPATERYEKLKSELIKRLSASQQQKIKRLLEHEELGDRRPSQFLRHLQSLAGTTVPENIVRSLWLGRLPASTQAILATQAKASLDAVAELADTISEAIAPRAHISEVSNALESTIEKLTAELAEMKIQLSSLSNAQAQANTYRRNRSNSRGRPYPRDRSYSRERNSDICWYHYRFGDQAQKCSPPCKHQGNVAGSR
ncbi:uncharacterized protein LOC126883623 [Diabrotica virgifera virgifera]|uniref:Dilute domain-containing protein n=1 Tax=Diabrotica virgifera virgifera TaxID=50390 RepID=A0ABM5K4W8_DIAVI|nr:uncharacterized protein LOC126883623 [Diabrotica virgifera virgifera]